MKHQDMMMMIAFIQHKWLIAGFGRRLVHKHIAYKARHRSPWLCVPSYPGKRNTQINSMLIMLQCARTHNLAASSRSCIHSPIYTVTQTRDAVYPDQHRRSLHREGRTPTRRAPETPDATAPWSPGRETRRVLNQIFAGH